MGEGKGKRLVVEVFNARNLMPKDGQGTASAYAVVDFDGQRRRTKTKSRDLNPQWEEKLEFIIHDPDAIASDTLELNVYNDKKNSRRNTFLGRVKISGSSFAKLGEEVLIYYPLEKRSVFSQVKGEIGIKVCYADDDEPPPQPLDVTPPPAEEKKVEETETKSETEEKKTEEEPKATEDKPKLQEAIITKEQPKENLQVAPPLFTPAKKLQNSRCFIDVERANVCTDLVDNIPYLFVRILKAKQNFKEEEDNSNIIPQSIFAKITIGSSYSVQTRTAMLNSDWDQAFSFTKESLNSNIIEISVNNEDKTITESSLGSVSFDISEIPKRSAPDSPLAPQWYTLQTSSPTPATSTDVMLAIWFGNQADEAFPESWQSDSGGLMVQTRSKSYLSPKLWYLRLTVIQTQDLRLAAATGYRTELFVKAQLGIQVSKTQKLANFSNPSWNEDLIFIATEPFEPFLSISVEDAVSGKPVGKTNIPISTIPRRTDDNIQTQSLWLNLAGDNSVDYSGRLHVTVCLEGGYHVLDEAPSNHNPSKPPVGFLEVGIRGAANLVPIKLANSGGGATDAYAVVKYGPKWARTRTILNQFNPRWNEQYTWQVFDPCTVFTVAVFDNSNIPATATAAGAVKDTRIGKIRICLSTLDTNRLYISSYTLTTVTPQGLKKMGDLELAIRFTCSSWLKLIQCYAAPVLPRMHYARPLGAARRDTLRHAAARAVAARLARSEPPLGAEVVYDMLGAGERGWSMRRSKANWFRTVTCVSRLAAAGGWVGRLRTWSNPMATVVAHLLVLAAVTWPEMVGPAVMMWVVVVVGWGYRKRGGNGGPGGIDAWLSCVDGVGPDEVDEELDGVMTGRGDDVVRARYDRLRGLAGRVQGILGDVAAQGEKLEGLVTWRDPRATGIFVVICVVAAVVLYVVQVRVLVVGVGFYWLRHPRFRGDMPAAAVNFYRRLPSMAERIL